MPFYEYECGSCGHRVEALQKLSDDPLVYCPECNAAALKKLISAAGFRLKGTGWYETDFKNSKKADAGKDDKPAADKSGAGKAESAGADAGSSKSSSADSPASGTSSGDGKAGSASTTTSKDSASGATA